MQKEREKENEKTNNTGQGQVSLAHGVVLSYCHTQPATYLQLHTGSPQKCPCSATPLGFSMKIKKKIKKIHFQLIIISSVVKK